jgi:hypothetical protein
MIESKKISAIPFSAQKSIMRQENGIEVVRMNVLDDSH